MTLPRLGYKMIEVHPAVIIGCGGKGSHVTLYLGDKLTIVRSPKDDLKTGTFHAMLKQLDITLDEIMGA